MLCARASEVGLLSSPLAVVVISRAVKSPKEISQRYRVTWAAWAGLCTGRVRLGVEPRGPLTFLDLNASFRKWIRLAGLQNVWSFRDSPKIIVCRGQWTASVLFPLIDGRHSDITYLHNRRREVYGTRASVSSTTASHCYISLHTSTTQPVHQSCLPCSIESTFHGLCP